jgi:FKBP-type peptidyl-prolyl cis-trans isomerase 2
LFFNIKMKTKNIDKASKTDKTNKEKKPKKIEVKESSSLNKVGKGNLVSIEYEGKLDNGEVFDTSKGHAPLQFIAGNKQVIEGFDNAVMGMKKGEEKEIHIKAKEAYGESNPALIHEIPKSMIKTDKEMKPGMSIVMATPDGHQIPLLIKEVKKDTILLDMNHPLAGKNLNFKVKVLEIKEATEEDKECSCGNECSCGDDCSCEDENHECNCDECGCH